MEKNFPSYFLSQLIKFEARLFHRGELTKDTPWSFEDLKDPEEKLLRNTYINGLNKNKIGEFLDHPIYNEKYMDCYTWRIEKIKEDSDKNKPPPLNTLLKYLVFFPFFAIFGESIGYEILLV